MEVGQDRAGQLIRLAVVRYLENDAKRALNTLVYRPRTTRSIGRTRAPETAYRDQPSEVEPPHIPNGITLVDHKLQLSLEAIYDGRYLTAISECTDVHGFGTQQRSWR